MKYVLIIGDGMADDPVAALGGRTPLEYAKKPVIDSLAARGVLGSVRNCPANLPAGSDTAIMSIFGCSPAKYYSGRAPLEAAAQGIALDPGDAAYRCNNVGLSEGGAFTERVMLSHSAGGITGAEGRELAEYLFSHPDFVPLAKKARMEINPTDSYRHIAVQRGVDITGLKMYPPHDNLNKRVADILPYGCENAGVLAELMAAANAILENHPINVARRAAGKMAANSIWFWAEGTAAALPNFKAQYGKTGAVISAVPLCHGIATLAGLDVITVEGANGEWDTNYEGKVAAALDALKTRDFVALHLEGPDEATHNGQLKEKVQAIEWLDSRVTVPVMEGLERMGEDYRMLILSDHKTLTESRLHGGDPVPYLIYDSRRDSGLGKIYTEAEAETETAAYLDEGTLLMPALFEL